MGDTLVLIHAAVSIVLVIGLIVWGRINPAIALVISSLYLGIVTGTGLTETTTTIAEGFGEVMASIGLVIGFGALIGSLAAESGAITRIAHAMLGDSGGHRRAPWAMTSTGMLVSTPVFYDVGYVLLAPLARSVGTNARVSIGLMAGALVFGLGTANTFVPPTPGPLAAAGTLDVSLGEMIGYGIIVALPTAFLGLSFYMWLIRRGLWNPAKDEESEVPGEERPDDATPLPGLGFALAPIVLPIVLILLGTVAEAASYDNAVIQFLGDRIVALLVGVLAAFVLAWRMLPRDRVDRAVNNGMGVIGVVLLVTGAGGAFGTVLNAAGVGDIIGDLLQDAAFAPILLVWVIAAVLKVAQGSGTVALITAANIIAPSADALGTSPVLLALAAASGSMFGAHVNDSGFWISVKLLGLSTQGGLKIYTLPCAIMSVFSVVVVLGLSVVA